MQTSRTKLIELLQDVEPALSQNLIVAMSHYWFTGKRLMTYSDKISISVPFPSDFVGAVPGALLAFLKTSRAEEIDLSTAADGVLIAKANAAKFKMAMLPAEDFVFKMPKAKIADPLPIDAGRFMQALELCMLSIGNDTSNPDHMGVTLLQDAKSLWLCSTDRETVSYGSIKLEEPIDMPDRVILRTDFCKQILRVAKGARELFLEFTDRYALLRHEGTTVYGELVEPEKPLDFLGLLKQEYTQKAKQHAVTLEGHEKLREMLERACIITNDAIDKTKTKITIDKGRAHFLSVSERGEITDTTVLAKPDEHPDVVAYVDPVRVLKGYAQAKTIAFTGSSVVLANGQLIYLVSSTEV